MRQNVTEKSVTSPIYDEALQEALTDTQDPDKVWANLLTAHQAGDGRATYAIAACYLNGDTPYVDGDEKRGLAFLKLASGAESSDALMWLANAYELGRYGLRANDKKAFKLYLRAALRNHAQAVFEVGRMYYYGEGIVKDRKIARIWLKRAEELDCDFRD